MLGYLLMLAPIQWSDSRFMEANQTSEPVSNLPEEPSKVARGRSGQPDRPR